MLDFDNLKELHLNHKLRRDMLDARTRRNVLKECCLDLGIDYIDSQ